MHLIEHTGKSLALLQGDASSQPIPILPYQLSELEHDLLPSHNACSLPCRECLLRTFYRRVELSICILWYSCNEVVRCGVVELDELCSFRFDELIIDEIGGILHILNLLVCSRIVFGGEGRSCSWLELLRRGVESASCDLRVLGC